MQLPLSEVDAATSASDFVIDGKKLTKYYGTEKDVSVPTEVEIIDKGAFEDVTTMESIVIPYSVKRIKAFAFWGCYNLSKVSLAGGLKEIGDYVFANCKGLQTFTVPKTITSIGIGAFEDCVNLTDITIPPEVTFIHETAFEGCKKLVIHAEMGSYAWKYAQDFYERQKEMEEYEDVPGYDPSKSETTENPEENTDTEIVESPSNTLLGTTFVVGNQAVVFIDNTDQYVIDGSMVGKEDDTTTGLENQPIYDDNNSILKYSIVDNRIVADQAYYRSQNLDNLVLSKGITEVGEFSFARSSLKSISIPDTTTTISYGAFYHCDALQSVVLPNSIQCVEPKAFTYTKWVEDFLTDGTGSKTDFLVSGGVLVAYRGHSTAVDIPEGVRVIAAEVFADHKEISSVHFPNSLTVVGEAAFEGCDGLSTIIWGSGLKEIKDRAFCDSYLSDVTIPESVTQLGCKVFHDTVLVAYEGKHPKETYEHSAQRLSNEQYRNGIPKLQNPGVTVSGVEHAYAYLDGALREYCLQIEKVTASKVMEKAFFRNLHIELPTDCELYQLTLTDQGNISITKLGKQALTVTLPIPQSYQGKEICVVSLDRNGQLELLPAKNVRIDGVEAIRFQTDYVSMVAIYQTGELLSDDIVEISLEASTSLSGPVKESTQSSELTGKEADKAFVLKILLAIPVLLAGIYLLLKRKL